MTVEIKELNILSEIVSFEKKEYQEIVSEIENRVLKRVLQELGDLKKNMISFGNER